jgi:hypothetical protein
VIWDQLVHIVEMAAYERLCAATMSQETGTETALGKGEATAEGGLRERLARAIAWLRAELFRPTPSGPIGWRKPLLAIVFLAAGAAISLSRTRGAGSLNTIWIEDAKFLLQGALNGSFWSALKTPISSYYQQPARAFTEVAIQFPLRWAPAIMSIFSALEYCLYGLVAYIASGPHLRSVWLRLLIAAPVCMIPLAYTQVNNDLVTVQFFGLYGAFWTVLWIPGTRWGKILSPIVMLTVSGTAALSIVFFPLIIVRLLVDRSKNAWALAICWLAGVLLQFSLTIQGKSNHYSYGYNGPFFVLKNYAVRVVPRALFGESALGGPGANFRGEYAPLHIVNIAAHYALIGCAWAIVAAAIILAVTRFTNPNWPLAAVAALFSIGIFIDELLVNVAVVQPRYIIAPTMLLYTALVALLRPNVTAAMARSAVALRWLPVAGFALLLAVAIGLNFRVTNGRTSSPAWSSVVDTARAACQVPGVTSYLYVHEWWNLTIPCSRVR